MMPSFRQKFVGFIRQLSNTSDSARDNDVPDNASECFIQNYLKGSDKVNKNEPVILHGKKPYEIPPLNIGAYDTNDIKAADTGPDGGLISVNKKEEEEKNGNNIIAGVDNWDNAHERAYGKSCSLYEVHPISQLRAGDPIADCYGILVRGNSAIIGLADGVNWGVKASIAAKAAVHGSIDYMNQHLFESASPKPATTTEVFTSLLRSFHTAHSLILQEKGMLTTLTTAVVLPLADSPGKYIVCTCNVGDSLAYVYSPKHGVREITQGSHDVHQMRDMRDALGALGPVDGQNPELSNLTLSMTELEVGDIVFLTSDGVSDNLDPVVGKFTGLPTVEAHQRHKLLLLRTEDLLRYGVSGKGPSIASARDLVTLLLDFVCRLTAAKRHVLEDPDLYAARDGGVLNAGEQIARRREVCKRLHAIPGKLDHATVVAYSVGEFGGKGRGEVGEESERRKDGGKDEEVEKGREERDGEVGEREERLEGEEKVGLDEKEELKRVESDEKVRNRENEKRLGEEKGKSGEGNVGHRESEKRPEENVRSQKSIWDKEIVATEEYVEKEYSEGRRPVEKVRVVETVVGEKGSVKIEDKSGEKKEKSGEKKDKSGEKKGGAGKRVESREERLRERREKGGVKGQERARGKGKESEGVRNKESAVKAQNVENVSTNEQSRVSDEIGYVDDEEEVNDSGSEETRRDCKDVSGESDTAAGKNERRIEGTREAGKKAERSDGGGKVSKFSKEREPLKGREGRGGGKEVDT